MCEKCQQHNKEIVDVSTENTAENTMSRRQFIGTVVVASTGAWLFLLNPSILKAGYIRTREGTDDCYLRLFNTLNRSKAHMAPANGATVGGKRTLALLMLLKAMFRYPDNHKLIKSQFSGFIYDYSELLSKNKDILAMILSCIGCDKEHSKTIDTVYSDFQQTYPDYADISKNHIENAINKFFIEFSLVSTNENNEYWCNPFVFGMGDSTYENMIVKMFECGTENPKWGKKFFKRADDYIFSPSKAGMVYQCWTPPLYRTIPAQLSSSEPGTDLFANYVAGKLHEFDKIENLITNNRIKYWHAFECGCMAAYLQRFGKKAKFATWFASDSKNLYDVSLRQELNQIPLEEQKIFEEINDTFYKTIAVAEDKYLMHLPYNIKKGDEIGEGSGYCNFLCHCHSTWCYQLRVRDGYWGEQVKNEKVGTSVSVVQKAFYNVTVKTDENACNGCHECYNRKPHKKKNGIMTQKFTCPAQAISKTREGISIDPEKCLGCLLCVRNCYRIRQSDDIALSVEQSPETDPITHESIIPENHELLESKRKESASELNWTSFQYEV